MAAAEEMADVMKLWGCRGRVLGLVQYFNFVVLHRTRYGKYLSSARVCVTACHMVPFPVLETTSLSASDCLAVKLHAGTQSN